MIILTSSDPNGGKVFINIDNIMLLQHQPAAIIGQGFTAVFMMVGPPYAVKETQQQIWDMMKLARAARRTEGLN
jgi:hypothetical protein